MNPAAAPTLGLPPLIPREVLFGNPERIGPSLSPDGARLAWVAPRDGVLNLWVADLGDLEATARPVTADTGRGISAYGWIADGTRLLYVQDQAGNLNFRVFCVHLQTGETRAYTPEDGTQARIVAASKNRPGQILVGLNRDNPQLHDTYRLDLDSGELTKVCTAEPGFLAVMADDDLVVRAALRQHRDGSRTLLIRDDDTAEWRELMTVGFHDTRGFLPSSFSADGKRILALSSIGADTTHLVWIDTVTGEQTDIYGDPGYDVATAHADINTKEPLLALVLRERLDTVVLDPSVADDVAAISALDGDIGIASTDHDNRVWLVAASQADRPTRYYTYHRDTGKLTFLFTHQPLLEQYTLAPMEPFTIEARDGLALHGYLTAPVGVARRDLPAVVMPHGGPAARDVWGYNPVVQMLANRGYLVIQVDYRGSFGYGKEHLAAGNREHAAKIHTDVLDALDWAVAQGWVDPKRVGGLGGSYGGYEVLIGLTHTPGVYACGVAMSAPVNLATQIASMPPWAEGQLSTFYEVFGHPQHDAELLWDRSPLSRAEKIAVPLLFAVGANDPIVPKTESDQLAAALTRNEIAHIYLSYGDEGHGLVMPANRLHFYAAAEQFLAEHLEGRAQPIDEQPVPASVTVLNDAISPDPAPR